MISKTPNRRLVPFYRRLGPEFSLFLRRGTMLVSMPTGQIIGGFQFDPTILDENKRWLSYFAQPLYVPSRFSHLSFGDRVPATRSGHDIVSVTGDERGIVQTIQIMKDTLPLVQAMLTLEGLYAYLKGRLEDDYQGSSSVYEALAYTALLLGFDKEFETYIEDNLVNHALLYGDTSLENEQLQPWERERLKRFFLMRDLLREKRYDDARKQLDVWQDFTVKSLKIEDLV